MSRASSHPRSDIVNGFRPDPGSDLDSAGHIIDLPADLDATARRVIGAARVCFAERGLADTTMEDVAAAAGVGVATVYRRFGSRRTVIRLAIVDEAIRIQTLLAEVADTAGSPEELIVETFAVLIEEAGKPQLLTRSLRKTPEFAELAAFLSDTTLMRRGRASVAAALRPWQESGRLSAELDLDVVGEILARLVNSLIATPHDTAIPVTDPARARSFARDYLVPILRLSDR